jgi:hypothetical protein
VQHGRGDSKDLILNLLAASLLAAVADNTAQNTVANSFIIAGFVPVTLELARRQIMRETCSTAIRTAGQMDGARRSGAMHGV